MKIHRSLGYGGSSTSAAIHVQQRSVVAAAAGETLDHYGQGQTGNAMNTHVVLSGEANRPSHERPDWLRIKVGFPPATGKVAWEKNTIANSRLCWKTNCGKTLSKRNWISSKQDTSQRSQPGNSWKINVLWLQQDGLESQALQERVQSKSPKISQPNDVSTTGESHPTARTWWCRPGLPVSHESIQRQRAETFGDGETTPDDQEPLVLIAPDGVLFTPFTPVTAANRAHGCSCTAELVHCPWATAAHTLAP